MALIHKSYRIASKFRQGEILKGTMLRVVSNPAIANIAKHTGFDFIMLDMEHGAYTFETLSNIFSIARSINLGAFVRVPELSRGYVSRALDCGANGVMVPMVETEKDAQQFVAWAKYPPLGGRGMSSIGGHTDYNKIDNLKTAMVISNTDSITIAQIETMKGVEAVNKIAAVNGIDVLLLGPNDLSVSLGCSGDLDSRAVEKSIKKIAKAAIDNGKIFGVHADFSFLKRCLPYGMRFIMNSTDINILIKGMKSINEEIETFTQNIKTNLKLLT